MPDACSAPRLKSYTHPSPTGSRNPSETSGFSVPLLLVLCQLRPSKLPSRTRLATSLLVYVFKLSAEPMGSFNTRTSGGPFVVCKVTSNAPAWPMKSTRSWICALEVVMLRVCLTLVSVWPLVAVLVEATAEVARWCQSKSQGCDRSLSKRQACRQSRSLWPRYGS